MIHRKAQLISFLVCAGWGALLGALLGLFLGGGLLVITGSISICIFMILLWALFWAVSVEDDAWEAYLETLSRMEERVSNTASLDKKGESSYND